jgi:hypothetical protein
VESLGPGHRLVFGSCEHGDRNRDSTSTQGICGLADEILGSQGLCSTDYVGR